MSIPAFLGAKSSDQYVEQVLTTGITTEAIILGYESHDEYNLVIYRYKPHDRLDEITCKKLLFASKNEWIPVNTTVPVKYLRSVPYISILLPYARKQWPE